MNVLKQLARIEESLSAIIEAKELNEMAWRDGRQKHLNTRTWRIRYLPELRAVMVTEEKSGVSTYETDNVLWDIQDFQEVGLEFGAEIDDVRVSRSSKTSDYEEWVVTVPMDPTDALIDELG